MTSYTTAPHRTLVTARGSTGHTGGAFWALTIGSLGVVYGDIGTSPLYAMREAVNAASPDAGGRGRHAGDDLKACSLGWPKVAGYADFAGYRTLLYWCLLHVLLNEVRLFCWHTPCDHDRARYKNQSHHREEPSSLITA
jgi:hypothetical protein